MDHNAAMAHSAVLGEEAALEALCFKTAIRNGHTVAAAATCDAGDVGCLDCPFQDEQSDDDWVATCIGCGCDDLHACAEEDTGNPCHWVRLDREAQLGVCSDCPEHAERWDDGDREVQVPATGL